MIIENGHVTHNCKLGVFTVLGTTGNSHAVQLFPKETCTCPSTGLCYHIMAVRMSIGIDQQKSLSKVNLSRLRRNARPKKDKTSGRKKPRPGDYDIKPAPDSLFSQETNNNVCGILCLANEWARCYSHACMQLARYYRYSYV